MKFNQQPDPQPNSSLPLWEGLMAYAGDGMYLPTSLYLDMHQRDFFGRKKYGTPLQLGNGRDFLTDAYEEALDLVVYLYGLLLESSFDEYTQISYHLDSAIELLNHLHFLRNERMKPEEISEYQKTQNQAPKEGDIVLNLLDFRRYIVKEVTTQGRFLIEEGDRSVIVQRSEIVVVPFTD